MDKRERLAAQQARRALERLAVLTLFLTPLLMNPLGQSLCGRIKIAAMWAAAGIAGFLLSRVRKSSLPPRLLWPGAFWILATVVSTFTAVSRVTGFWGFANLVPGVILALMFAEVSRKAGTRRRLMVALVGSAGITSAYAIAQHYGLDVFEWITSNPLKRASGTLGGPVYLGAFLAMALPFAVSLTRMRRRPRWLTTAVTAIVIALAVSYSRAAWVGAAAGVIVAMYSSGRAWAKPVHSGLASLGTMIVIALPLAWKSSHTLALALAAPLALFVLWWLTSLPGYGTIRRSLVVGLVIAGLAVFVDARRPETGAYGRIANATAADSQAASTRKGLWVVASGLISARPFLGYGPDTFRIAASSIARDAVNMPAPLLLPHQSPHSEWYTAAIEGGGIGLIAWAMVVLGIASLASDRTRAETGLLKRGETPSRVMDPTSIRRADTSAAVFGAVAAFAIQGSLTPRAPATTLCLALCWGIAAALEPIKKRKTSVPVRMSRIAGYGWGGAAIVMALSILGADMVSGRGERLQKQGRMEAAVPYYRMASLINPTETGYRRVWGETALQVAATKTGMEAIAFAEEAAEAYAANLDAEPGNGIWRAGLANSLCYLNPREAVTEARQAVDEAKVSSTTWLALARAYRANGNTYNEKCALRAAIESEPVEPAAYVRLAGIFRDEQRADLSDRVLGWAADLYPEHTELAPWRGKGLAR